MLQRIWRCTVALDRVREYEQFAREISFPMFRAHPGFRGCLMSRIDGKCEVLTLWDDKASIDGLDASPAYISTVQKIRATGFILEQEDIIVSAVHLAALPDTLWLQ